MQRTFQSDSLEQTQQIAADFAQQFKENGGLILLSGNLGAGKTSFTQGFIRSFQITQHITSPTFLLVRQYQIPETDRWIFHLDLYRLVEPIDLTSTGIQEVLDSVVDGNIVLIEWSEKIKDQLENKEYYEVYLEKKDESGRIITIKKP